MSPQVLALVAASLISAASGWKVTSWYYQSQISDMLLDAAQAAQEARDLNDKIEVMGLELAGVVSERDAARRQKARNLQRVVTRKVIEYVQNPAIERVHLPAEWVRLHDTAASGRMSEDADPAGPTDDPAVGVTDADAIAVVTDNYGICDDTRRQLIGLQEWAAGIGRIQGHNF